MPDRRLFLALTFLAFAASALVAAVPANGAADEFSTEYSVTLMGIPVGAARVRARFADGRYTISLSGRVKGLARLFSDGEASAAVAGTLGHDGLSPRRYRHVWTEDDDTERVELRFTGREATALSVDPPPRHRERDVPLTKAHLRDVLDPASAFIWPAPVGAAPEICRRSLAVFSGRHRFDLEFGYSRSATFRADDGSYSGPAIVCTMRYRPVAGHRRNKESVRFMAANRDMEIWMAPAAEGFVAPVKIRIRTKTGPLVLKARRFAGP